MHTPIPVGLIGLGRHGSRYLHHLLDEETGGQLVAISRQQEAEGRRQAAHHHLRFFPDYRQLIADPTIRAVLVITPPRLNAPIALEAIAHRKALLVEKPLTVQSHEGRHIVNAAAQAKVPLMTGHTLRYEPVIRKVKDIATHLGHCQALRGTMHLKDWQKDPHIQRAGHGVLLEIGIHLLDWIRVMLPTESLIVSATTAPAISGTPEKRAEISLATPSGIRCQLDIARVHTKQVTQIEFIGTTGRVRGDWKSGLVQVFDQENLISEEMVPATPTLVPMLKDFFQALQTGQPMPITGVDGLRAVELAEACHEAARTGQSIEVK